MAGPDPQASVSAATARPSQGAFAGSVGATGTVPAGTSSLRRDILVELRRNGPTSPEQLATRLGASRTGVLQQLRALEAAGLVDRRTVRHGVGRPRHLYDVTPDAQDAVPVELRRARRGSARRDRRGRRRRPRRGGLRRPAPADRPAGEGPPRRAAAGRRVARGPRPRARRHPGRAGLPRRARSIDSDGTIRLREHNCAIFEVASASTSPCEAELALFREVLGADVVRETHIASGDRCCTYRISEPAEA